jgi:hypothetical protein
MKEVELMDDHNDKTDSNSKPKINKGLIGIITCFIILGIIGYILNKNYNKINSMTSVQIEIIQVLSNKY